MFELWAVLPMYLKCIQALLFEARIPNVNLTVLFPALLTL